MSNPYADMQIEELKDRLLKLRVAIYETAGDYNACVLPDDYGHSLCFGELREFPCETCELRKICAAYKGFA